MAVTLTKFLPVMVTFVPPAAEPDFGVMAVTGGAGTAAATPVPVTLMACVGKLLATLIVPLTAPTAAGWKKTCRVQDLPGSGMMSEGYPAVTHVISCRQPPGVGQTAPPV